MMDMDDTTLLEWAQDNMSVGVMSRALRQIAKGCTGPQAVAQDAIEKVSTEKMVMMSKIYGRPSQVFRTAPPDAQKEKP